MCPPKYKARVPTAQNILNFVGYGSDRGIFLKYGNINLENHGKCG
jgi:hypothetical protein